MEQRGLKQSSRSVSQSKGEEEAVTLPPIPWVSEKLAGGPGCVSSLLLLGYPRVLRKEEVVLFHPHPLVQSRASQGTQGT